MLSLAFLTWSRPARRLLARVGVALLCVGCLLPADADAKPKKEKKKKESSLQVPIPIGHSAEGVKLPDYGEDGQRLQMNFEIGSATRVSDDQLEMKELRIETFNEAGTSEMLILMPISQLDLKSRIVSSVDPVTIRRADMELTGGNMSFDTRTRQGKFSGPTRMLIFNREGLTSNADANPSTPETGE